MQNEMFETLAATAASSMTIDELLRRLACGTPSDVQLATLLEATYQQGWDDGMEDETDRCREIVECAVKDLDRIELASDLAEADTLATRVLDKLSEIG